MATEITLEKCKVQLSEREFNDMDKYLTTDELRDVLKLSNNGKAPGNSIRILQIIGHLVHAKARDATTKRLMY
jgi:hypothetical protein